MRARSDRASAARLRAANCQESWIVTLIESENMPITRQTVQRWLSEDAAASLVEKTGKFGHWKWRGGL